MSRERVGLMLLVRQLNQDGQFIDSDPMMSYMIR